MAEIKVKFYNQVSSVMDEAWKMAASRGLEDWESFLAQTQTGGRGRQGRVWQSPKGHIYAAVVLPPEGFFTSPSAAISLAVIIRAALLDLGAETALKWPNDLVTAEGKVGGLLVEARQNFLVAGFGLNLIAPPDVDLKRDLAAPPPAALNLADPPEVLWPLLLEGIVAHYRQTFKHLDQAAMMALAQKLLIWRGAKVRVEKPSATPQPPTDYLTGYVLGLSPEGALLVTDGQVEYKVWSGGVLPVPRA